MATWYFTKTDRRYVTIVSKSDKGICYVKDVQGNHFNIHFNELEPDTPHIITGERPPTPSEKPNVYNSIIEETVRVSYVYKGEPVSIKELFQLMQDLELQKKQLQEELEEVTKNLQSLYTWMDD